jgi:inner membrane protein
VVALAMRGIGAIHAPEVNGRRIAWSRAGDQRRCGGHPYADALAEDNKTLEIAFTLDLNGTGSFSVVPLGATASCS